MDLHSSLQYVAFIVHESHQAEVHGRAMTVPYPPHQIVSPQIPKLRSDGS